MHIRMRRGRPVKTAQAKAIRPDGSSMSISIAFMDIDADEIEQKAVIQCSRIWDWGVARGFTADSGDYVALNGLGKQQVLRMRQEDRYGLR